jgi:N-methylhydantoinase B
LSPPPALELVELEILRKKLEALVRELGSMLGVLGRSSEIRESRSFALALVDADGGVVALDNPLQLAFVEDAVRSMLAQFRFDSQDGDVILVSDPYAGGSRVQDFTLLTPYAVENVVRLYLCARLQMPDMGGDAIGSVVPSAREIWAEGVPIPPVKLYRWGRPRRDVLTSVLLNSRRPDDVDENLGAIQAAFGLGRRRIAQLVGRYGLERILAASKYAQDYAETRARRRIRSWRDGTCVGVRVLDHDGVDGPAVTVRARATVSGDQISIDFSDSDTECTSFLNSTLSVTKSSATAAFLAMLGDDIPANSGAVRTVTISSAEGAVTHARFPAAVGGGPIHLAVEIAEATAAALQPLAETGGGALTAPQTFVLTWPSRGAQSVDVAAWAIAGCAGAAGRDGWGAPHLLSRPVRPTVEEWERSQDLFVERLELVPDTGGLGRWRGSPAVEAAISVGGERAWTVSLMGRRTCAPGVAGGREGGASALEYESESGDAVEVGASATARTLPRGRLIVRFGGGGGYGHPLERDPLEVCQDVVNGLVSVDAAVRDYGVVLTDDAAGIDTDATLKIRGEK